MLFYLFPPLLRVTEAASPNFDNNSLVNYLDLEITSMSDVLYFP